jgi:hypothetical protein
MNIDKQKTEQGNSCNLNNINYYSNTNHSYY